MAGEDTASMGIVIKEEPVGPGLALAKNLGENYEIVATVICGDNYIAENTDEVCRQLIDTVKKYKGQLLWQGLDLMQEDMESVVVLRLLR